MTELSSQRLPVLYIMVFKRDADSCIAWLGEKSRLHHQPAGARWLHQLHAAIVCTCGSLLWSILLCDCLAIMASSQSLQELGDTQSFNWAHPPAGPERDVTWSSSWMSMAPAEMPVVEHQARQLQDVSAVLAVATQANAAELAAREEAAARQTVAQAEVSVRKRPAGPGGRQVKKRPAAAGAAEVVDGAELPITPVPIANRATADVVRRPAANLRELPKSFAGAYTLH